MNTSELIRLMVDRGERVRRWLVEKLENNRFVIEAEYTDSMNQRALYVIERVINERIPRTKP